MKTILLTGVSSGLGAEIAERLLSEGYALIGLSRSQSDTVKALQSQFPDTFHFHSLDLSLGADELLPKLKSIIPLDQPLHAFINNAGTAYDDLITNAQSAPLENQFRVNVHNPILICREVIRNFIAHQTPGRILHITSITAHQGFTGLSMYGASKGAIESFSKGLAREWGKKGITSNCIAPGFMDTPMTDTLNAQTKEKIHRQSALKRPVSTSAVTSTIQHLLTDATKDITGETIRIDCGRS